jgi:hypothetical protein
VADALTPWWIAAATGAFGGVAGVIGKVWAAHRAVVAELRTELATARAELAEANATIVRLQEQATQRGDEHQREHLKDLRRLAGLSNSLEPPRPGEWPPVIIREAPPVPRRSPVVREAPPLPGLPPRKMPREPR